MMWWKELVAVVRNVIYRKCATLIIYVEHFPLHINIFSRNPIKNLKDENNQV